MVEFNFRDLFGFGNRPTFGQPSSAPLFNTGLSDYFPNSSSTPSLSESAGNMSSEGASDFQHAFAGSGITVDRDPIKDAPGYTASINSIGNFIIRDPSGRPILSHGEWSSDSDYEAYVKAKEAAEEPVVVETPEPPEDPGPAPAPVTTSSNSGRGDASGGRADAEEIRATAEGPAEEKVADTAEKGRRSTIQTSPQGLLSDDVPTRKKRSLMGGGLIS